MDGHYRTSSKISLEEYSSPIEVELLYNVRNLLIDGENVINRSIIGIFAAALAVAFTGCTSAIDKVPEQQVIIPGAPEEPRLLYVASYRGESDFSSKNAIDVLIGESGPEGGAVLKKPYGVGGYKGKIYVTDTGKAVVFVIDPLLKKITFIGDQPNGKLALPVSVAFDKTGNVYVSDAKQKRINVYDQNGTFIREIASNNEFMRPTGIAINTELGLLYGSDTLGHNIKIFTLEGKLVSTVGKRGEGEGEFNYPTNIAIDRRNGNVIVGDTQNFRIQVFDKNGKYLYKFGQIGDKPGMFARPKGVAVDSEGHIYVADAAFNNIQVFNDKGELLLYFGGAGLSPATFQLPATLSFDEDDRLLTTEAFNPRVQVFQYLSEEWKRKHPVEYKKMREF